MADSVTPIGPLADVLRRVGEMEQRISAGRGVESGGGGGDSTGMEARVAKLEAHMEHVLADTGLLKSDVGQIKMDVASASATLKTLPDKEYVSTTMRNWALVAAAIIGAINAAVLIVSRALS